MLKSLKKSLKIPYILPKILTIYESLAVTIPFRVACLRHVSVRPDNQNFCHNRGNFKAKTTGGLGEMAAPKEDCS